MALQSKLFNGDAKLEAAAVSDPAHILPGASGQHVEKIQAALNLVDNADLTVDGKYGPATAAAVLRFKQKRNIVNRSYQTQADNIVGKMTIAALDAEVLAKENVAPGGPIRIVPLRPHKHGFASASGLAQRSAVRMTISGSVGTPVRPDGSIIKIRLAPRTTGILEIVDGQSGRIVCRNMPPPRGECREKISLIFDPAQPSVVQQARLVPEPVGPFVSNTTLLADGGTLNVRGDLFVVNVDAFRPGDAFIDASNATASSTVFVEVRAEKLGDFLGRQTGVLTETRPNSKFMSFDRHDDKVPGSFTGGRPVNPTGTGRKINLGGEGETPDFENYTGTLAFSGFNHRITDNKWVFRPWSEDTNPRVRIGDGEAGDICIRGVPVDDIMLNVIKRIKGAKCRLTYAGGADHASYLLIKSIFATQQNIVEDFESTNDIIIDM